MIDVKQAVKIARDYITNLFDQPLRELQLEEVQLSDDDKYWLITFGYDTDRMPALEYGRSGDFTPVKPQYIRDYKIVTVDAETGKPISMKIREL